MVGKQLEVSSRHDWNAYKAIFASGGRIHIPDFLVRSDAEYLHEQLALSDKWSTVINTDKSVYDLPQHALEALSPEDRTRLDNSIIAAASKRYQFRFDTWRISENGELPPADNPLWPLAKLLNGPRFLTAMKNVLGRPDIAFADMQATRYMPGHFLHIHDDIDTGKGRIAAYVLNLTPTWATEWGGLLCFTDGEGHVSEGYTPKFNALNLLKVGSPHFVSFVAPFASAPRLSVTGWLRSCS
jgi:hypothetical protein